jgi:hypothetical protein
VHAFRKSGIKSNCLHGVRFVLSPHNGKLWDTFWVCRTAPTLSSPRPGYDLWFDLICDLLLRLDEFLGINANWMTTTIGDIRSNRASRDIASFPAPVTIPRGAHRAIVPRIPVSVSSSLALGGRRSLEVQPLSCRQLGSIVLQIATFLPSGSLRV